MFHTTFNPGPSQISDNTRKDIRRSLELKITEMSHRSSDFSEMSARCVFNIRKFFNVPDDYRVFYTASATDAMILSIRNCVAHNVFHFTNGNFSEYWAKISQSLGKTTKVDAAEWGQQNNFKRAQITPETELVTLTYNETSTGVMASQQNISMMSEICQDALLAVDITSIAGMQTFDIRSADIWLYSVQKALGLPAGLGVMLVSPRAYRRSQELSQQGMNTASVFSFENMEKKMYEKYQTVCTPHALNIFLLGEKLARWNARGGVDILEKEAHEKLGLIHDFVEHSDLIDFFVPDKDSRSSSIVCLQSNAENILNVHKKCQKNKILMGKGYGKLKDTTIRIANFPALSKAHMESLVELLET